MNIVNEITASLEAVLKDKQKAKSFYGELIELYYYGKDQRYCNKYTKLTSLAVNIYNMLELEDK